MNNFEQMTKLELKLKSVPESEIIITASRSSGAGGQNVNKVNSKVELRWPVLNSNAFDSQEKLKIIEKLKNRINKENQLIVVCQETRDQGQNKIIALKKLQDLIALALTEEKERKLTKPNRVSKEKRLEEKKVRSNIIANRSKPSIEE